MRAAALLIVLGLLLGAPGAATPPPQGVSVLAWMAGHWVEEKDGGWAEESWAHPREEVMLGTSLSGRRGKAGDYEFMRIAPDGDGTPTYWASPGGASPVPFRMTSSAGGSVVFENPRHDYPTRIAYRRTGNVLTATISGPGGANPMSWRYTRR
jgi:hypothetical protein